MPKRRIKFGCVSLSFYSVLQHYDGDIADLCLTFSVDEEHLGKVDMF